MKAVIPLAGRGTRLYPLGLTIPKGLVRVLNKPVLQWTIEALQQNDVTEIILVIGEDKFAQQIKTYFTHNHPYGVKVSFTVQKEKLGTAHALQTTKAFFLKGEKFIFLMGDDLYDPQIISQLKNKELAILAREVGDPEKWGILQTNIDGTLKRIIEKPDHDVGNLANIACYLLDTRVFDLFSQLKKSSRGDFEITDTITLLAQQDQIDIVTAKGYWQSIGYPWHQLLATKLLMEKMSDHIQGKVEKNVYIKGKLILPKSSTIKSGTCIEGNVIIGENVVIGPQVYLQGHIVIGDNSVIDFGSSLRNSVIGRYNKITHSTVNSSIFGDYVNFPHSLAVDSLNEVGRNPLRKKDLTVSTMVKGGSVDTKLQKFGVVVGDHVNVGVRTIIYPGIKLWSYVNTNPGEIVRRDIVNTWA